MHVYTSAVLIILSIFQCVYADGDTNPDNPNDEVIISTKDEFNKLKAQLPRINSLDNLQSLTGKQREEYLTHLLEHKKITDSFDHNKNVQSLSYNLSVFEWQRWSTKVIFWIVIFLVSLGSFLSVFQFYKSYKIVTRVQTELSISDKGFTIKTSVIGLVILALSLAFFYFYIAFVYPISAVGI